MKRINVLVYLFLTAILISCSAEKTKEKINKAGNLAGETVGEFVTGVSSGVEKALDIKVQTSLALEENGIQTGKIIVQNDSIGTDNLLIAYIIFNKDFKGSLTAKAYDPKGVEMGRSKVEVEGLKDEAMYIEFAFGKYANLDNHSRVVLE